MITLNCEKLISAKKSLQVNASEQKTPKRPLQRGPRSSGSRWRYKNVADILAFSGLCICIVIKLS